MSDICSDITLNMSGLRTQCLDLKEVVERETPYVNDMLFLVRLLNAAKNILAAKKDSDPNGQLKTSIFTAVFPYLAIGKVSNYFVFLNVRAPPDIHTFPQPAALPI